MKELDFRHLDRRKHVTDCRLLNCQSVRLGTKTIDEYIKEFKGISDGLATIHKPVDEDNKSD